MPKSNAEMVRESLARRRQRARDAGLCYFCCKRKPNPGRTVCKLCRTAKMESKRRKSQRDRATAEFRQIVSAHEAAGDRAREHHLHEDAAQHYQDALSVATIAPDDDARISEKLAYALSLSRTPTAASPLFDRAIESYRDKPAESEKMVEMLLQRARQLWLDSRTAAAIPLLVQAVEVAETSGNTRLRTLARCRTANYLIGLARYREAAAQINAIPEIPEHDGALHATYYTQKAMLAGTSGNAVQAFEYFERALDVAHQDPDPVNIISLANAYANWAFYLGDIRRAKTHLERALLIARRYHVGWRISDLCLLYAGILFRGGQYGAAHEYLQEAISHEVSTPLAEVILAIFGVPIALYMHDEIALARCARLSTIDFAFRSEEPWQIGLIAAVFAEWYVVQGREQEAQLLLNRALRALDADVLEYMWDFPITVARFGKRADIPAARRFLESLAILPSSDVAKAYVHLFDAYAAQCEGRLADVECHASEAAKRFNVLEWYGLADLAGTLLPIEQRLPPAVQEPSFPEFASELTLREQQVAKLVLKGLTNREIAAMLAIKERTVEAHMTAIMKHLGVRSRYELTYRMRTPQ